MTLVTYCVTYLFNPWSGILLEKLSASQLVKKFSAFYRSRRLITAFTSVRYLSLSWTRFIQTKPPYRTSWISTLTLSSLLRQSFPSALFPSGCPPYPPKPCTHLFFTPYLLRVPSHSSQLYHPKISGEDYSKLNSSLCSFLYFRYLVPPRPKYFPQHPIFKHHQPTFFPQCEGPRFITIQQNRIYINISVYFNLCIFVRQKILHKMITSIPWLQTVLNFFLGRILIR